MTTGYKWLRKIRIRDGVLLSEYGNQQLLRTGKNIAILIWQFDIDGFYLMCALTLSEAFHVATRDRLHVGVLEPIRSSMEHESALVVVESVSGEEYRLVPFNIDRGASEEEFIDDLYDLVGAPARPLTDPDLQAARQLFASARELATIGR